MKKKRGAFWKIKYVKAKTLEWLVSKEEDVGYLQARLYLLGAAFIISTVITLLLFFVSGIIFYARWIPVFFAASNIIIMYHIVKPYLVVMNRWVEEE